MNKVKYYNSLFNLIIYNRLVNLIQSNKSNLRFIIKINNQTLLT